MHVKEAEARLGSQIPWLCDKMDNQAKHALGDAPNAEFLVDPEGRVAYRKAWSDPQSLRRTLEEKLGPVDRPTQVSDLDLKMELELPSAETIPTGLVPRVERPRQMVPLRLEPRGDSRIPYYVKPRAEVERSFFRNERGKLYLGFHLDRIYEVHWNNQVDPLSFQIKAPEPVTVTPSEAAAPGVKEPADKDPREFLLELSSRSDAPLELSVRYFACDDANTFCVPVTQHYAVYLERDPDGGSSRPAGSRGGPAAGFRNLLWERDQDGDGMLSPDEVPEQVRRRFPRMDSNGDGFLEESEFERARGRGPVGGPGRIFESDADGDGRISRDEAPEPLRRRWDEADANQDGFLDRDELRRLFERMRPQRPR